VLKILSQKFQKTSGGINFLTHTVDSALR